MGNASAAKYSRCTNAVRFLKLYKDNFVILQSTCHFSPYYLFYVFVFNIRNTRD